MLTLLALAFAAAGTAASVATQTPLLDPSEFAEGSTTTRILTHESHPDHSLTITAHSATEVSINGDVPTLADICPGATSGYTGYLNSGSKHFYFAYFKSRSKPETDPLVLWLNGGPGCSSMTGLFFELGPCLVNEDGESARENPNSWINAASVFFLDQPIGVGFSYVRIFNYSISKLECHES
jgi:carboxypeptidase C (cathepsin A)